MTRLLSSDQGQAFQAHTLQIVLFKPFTYEPNVIPGSLIIVSSQSHTYKKDLGLRMKLIYHYINGKMATIIVIILN